MCSLRKSGLVHVLFVSPDENGCRISAAGTADFDDKAKQPGCLDLRSYNLMVLPVVMLFLLFVTGCCGTLPNGRGWGQDATLFPDCKRICNAACKAATDPVTLIGLAGFGVSYIDDFDERVSDWATDHNPIFGSEHAAKDFSDFTRSLLGIEAGLTALMIPSGGSASDCVWFCSKFKGGMVESGAVAATMGVTELLKDECDRVRPDGSSDRSFPSGHTSEAFSFATLANRNLDHIDFESACISSKWRGALQGMNLIAATGVGWARVEGRRHYPRDVFFGAALGRFLSVFIHDAFLGLSEDQKYAFQIVPSEDGIMVQMGFSF